MKAITFIFLFFSLFIFFFACEELKVSKEVVSATAPAEASNVIGSPTDTSASISWQAPTLTKNHKKADGTQLTKADLSYKVYHVAKGKNTRYIGEIKKADTNPLAVAKGITSITITNLKPTTTYEIVVQSVNTTDPTKISIGIKAEVTTLATNHATAPAEASNVTGSTTDISATISWQAPTLTSSHKKPDGTKLTTADVSYKVYRVAKGSDERTIAQIKEEDRTPIEVAKGTTSTTIPNLKPTTTYEVVVQAVNSTDTTKASTGIRIEVTTLATISMRAKQQGSSSTFTTLSATAQGKDGTTEITPILMEVTPSSVVSGGTFSINPDITANTGISFNTSNGTLSGVAKYAQPETAYTVTFTATDGRTAETTITITVAYKYSPNNKAELIKLIKDKMSKSSNRPDLNNIDVRKITDMSRLFTFTTRLSAFNGDISKWDVSKVTDMSSMFSGATAFNGDISKWDVSKVTDMEEMFGEASAFSGDISNWNVGKVTDMSVMFAEASAFNGDISNWNVEKVTDMSGMFYKATAFNGDISRWDVSKVTKMTRMFYKAIAFNRDISTWDVSKVTAMSGMFKEASSFTQDLEVWKEHIGSKQVSKSATFDKSKVSKLPTWYFSITASSNSITHIVGIALPREKELTFTKSVSIAGTYAISPTTFTTDTGLQFDSATGKISGTPIKAVSNKEYTVQFSSTSPAHTYVDSERSKVITVTITTNQATAPADVRNITAQNITDDSASILWQAPTLTSSHKKADGTQLTTADVSYKVYRVVKGGSDRTIAEIIGADNNPSEVTKRATTGIAINNLTESTTYEIVVQAVNATNTTKVSTGIRIEVTTLASIGMRAKQQGSSTTLTTLSATAQGKDGTTEITPIVMEVTPNSLISGGTFLISPANITERIGLSFNESNGTISGVAKYAQPETTYTVYFSVQDGREAQITIDITVVHKYSPKNRADLITLIQDIMDTDDNGKIDDIDPDLNIIDTSNITDMTKLFSTRTKLHVFNGDISKWDVSNVTTMFTMFASNKVFNGDISKWDVSKVTDMDGMFNSAIKFNGDISNWNVSKVTYMDRMFFNATAFNGDISKWDVRKVTDMALMFHQASAFNKDISDWNVESVTNMFGMFNLATSFTKDLEAWGEHIGDSVNMSLMFDDSGVKNAPSWYKE